MGIFLTWSHSRSLTISYSIISDWLRGQIKPVCQLWSQVCHSSQLHHSSLVLHRHGHCKVRVTPEQHQNLTNTFDRNTVVVSILSISAQSNFAVGAVVNATFGSITELTFYITALLRGHHQGNKCLQEIVKAALTGTLLGCILFIPVWDLLHHRGSEICQVCNAWPLYLCACVSQGISMIIGGFKHREQRFNSRSAGVSSSLLFISVGGKTSCAMRWQKWACYCAVVIKDHVKWHKQI